MGRKKSSARLLVEQMLKEGKDKETIINEIKKEHPGIKNVYMMIIQASKKPEDNVPKLLADVQDDTEVEKEAEEMMADEISYGDPCKPELSE